MTGTRLRGRERKQNLKEEVRKAVTLRREETRTNTIMKRRPSEQDMNDPDDGYHQVSSQPDAMFTPPASPDDLMMAPDDPWLTQCSQVACISPPRGLLSPCPSVHSDSGYFGEDGKEAQTKVDMIRTYLANGQVAVALTQFNGLLHEYKPADYDPVDGLVHDHSFASKLLSQIGCNTGCVTPPQDIEMDMDVIVDATGRLAFDRFDFSPAKSGFDFEESPVKSDFCLDLVTIPSTIVKRPKHGPSSQDNKCVRLALEAIHAIIDEGYGDVFGNVSKFIPILIKQIVDINDYNRKVVLQSFAVITVMMSKSFNLVLGAGQVDQRTSLFTKLVEFNLFQALEHVSKVLHEDIAASRRKRIEPTEQMKIIDAMVIILRDFIEEMEKYRKFVKKERSKAPLVIDEWQEAQHRPVKITFDRDVTIVVLLRTLCIHTHKNKNRPDLVELTSSFLEMYKEDIEFEFGPSLNLLKNEDVGVALRKDKLGPAPDPGTPDIRFGLLPYFHDLLDKDRSKDIQLTAIKFLEALPYEVVVKQGLFYPLLDLVVGAPMKVRCKALKYLRTLVEYGPSEIMVLATSDLVKNIIPDMIENDGGKLSHYSIRLIRKLFQRAYRFNAMSNLIVPATGISLASLKMVSNSVPIVEYMKKKLSECNGTAAIFYTWYWGDSYMWYDAEWMAKNIYNDVNWTEHTKEQAFNDWDPVPEVEPVLIDTLDGCFFSFGAMVKKPHFFREEF